MTMKIIRVDSGLSGPPRTAVHRVAMLVYACLALSAVACSAGDLLRVPLPTGTIGNGSLTTVAGAENAFSGAKATIFFAISGSSELTQWSEVMSDEFTWSAFGNEGTVANIDARITHGGSGFQEAGDFPLGNLMVGRSAMLVVLPALQALEPSSSHVGEAFALSGYVELLLAEDYCAGVPLDYIRPGGGIQYTSPLSSDSLLGVAEAHFDSAVVHAASDPNVLGLASIGLGRARLNRANFQGAATAVRGIPTSFVYNTELAPTGTATNYGSNLYAANANGCGSFTMSDREGVVGLPFVSANDPRVLIDSTLVPTCDGGVLYFPVKFGLQTQSLVPLATGIEARLVEAESQWQGGQPSQWASSLNSLRLDSADTQVGGLDTLTTDSTTGAQAAMQIAVMFRERAFWLYGTGSRLSDLRRQVRQYGKAVNAVYPNGPYAGANMPGLPSPLPSYGSDVTLTLPTGAGASSGITTPNTNYRGCLNTNA